MSKIDPYRNPLDKERIAALRMAGTVIVKPQVEERQPGQSPLVPNIPVKRSKYTDFQIKEAIALAAKVGVAESSRITGVHPSSIYKQAANPRFGKDTGRSRAKAETARLATSRKMIGAAKMAMSWFSNQPIKTSEQRRACFDRAARRFRIEPSHLWRDYTANRISEVPYSPSIHG